MAAAADIRVSPHENDMVVQMRGFAQRMIRAVAGSGSSAATPEVLAFQQAWNRNIPIIQSLLRKLGSTQTVSKLVEDGKYGPRTGTALCGIICGGAITGTPSKASAMPVWYAQNRDAVDGLQPPSAPPVMSVLDEPMPIPGDSSDADAAQAVINSGGSTVRNIVPVQPPSSTPAPGAPQVISTTTSVVPTGVSPPQAELQAAAGPSTPAAALTDAELAALETDTGFTGEEIHIVTTRPRSRVPWIAVGLGAAGLGGLMFWWTQRKKRR